MERARLTLQTGLLAAVSAAFLLGCGGTAPTLTTATLPAPGQLAPEKPVSLTQASPAGEPTSTPALMPLNQPKVKRAVERYLVNSGGKPATHTIVGADLDSDSTPEALVYLQGADWCASTGCTLMVMRKGRTGYEKIALIKRVKLPVAIARTSQNGWRDLVVKSGQLGAMKLVSLKFDGTGYPGNASTVQASAPSVDAPPEIAIRPTRTAARAVPAGSNLIADQN